ncbi:transcription factor DYT1-like [Papaver somniferum]|uniref:transcription factor DYT1-like n=1 Tax=Papaver somniferum TaxID=3469 RepID=UPI000E700A1F|nr:transcription factor DYT1-like [Papaver somniferum]
MKYSGSGSGRGRGTLNEHGILVFKSKNLDAERRRRDKLNARLMELRSIVPILTSMTKAVAIDDVITYIKGLQKQVEGLSDCLNQMDVAVPQALVEESIVGKVELDQNIEKYTIEEQVKVTSLEGDNLSIKITTLGYEIMDNNFTSFKGVCLTTLSVKGNRVEITELEKLEELLLKVVRGLNSNVQL